VALLAFAALPGLAHAAASWQSGPLVEVQHSECIFHTTEYEAGSYLSYYVDPANPPQTGQVYYVAIDVTGIGNTCAGIYADINLTIPSGTAPAVSAQNPVKCYLQFPRSNSFVRDTGAECPQNLPVGAHGYSLDPVGVSPPFWPLPQGAAVELQVPVVSTQPLNGTSQLHGFVQLADGESNPTLAPSLVTIVNPAAVDVLRWQDDDRQDVDRGDRGVARRRRFGERHGRNQLPGDVQPHVHLGHGGGADGGGCGRLGVHGVERRRLFGNGRLHGDDELGSDGDGHVRRAGGAATATSDVSAVGEVRERPAEAAEKPSTAARAARCGAVQRHV
jgi:hypothetical protein